MRLSRGALTSSPTPMVKMRLSALFPSPARAAMDFSEVRPIVGRPVRQEKHHGEHPLVGRLAQGGGQRLVHVGAPTRHDGIQPCMAAFSDAPFFSTGAASNKLTPSL